jgi:hypothetical protein
MYYTYLEFINEIPLPSDTILILEKLDKSIIVPPEDNIIYKKYEKDDDGFVQKKNRKKQIVEEKDSWKQPKLIATVIEKKEGIDKDIGEIRAFLNKMTEKNAEIQKKNIIEKISNIIVDNEEEDLLKISNAIFEIASTQRYSSVLYAELYKELISRYEIFHIILNKFIDNFQNKINNTDYDVDDSDFDKFCEFNKLNDKQKSTCLFIVNLVKIEVITSEILLNFIDYYMKYITNLIDEENKISVVENITEYIFILIPKEKLFVYYDLWNKTIVPQIYEFSKKKRQNHKSLSSRVIFRFQEISVNISLH